ncbi:transcription termination factor NusA [Chitinispirillales bacterium ANBcel5]|uniref:transcription termination factor NusA n=1 Tax=Cellulosispirillum alkaliphilum TaxID=3039283 RepID=UPI002A524225|nr:transcription termination factor NusA [Chitinispirillales bacterium ANBcel5]
MKKKSRNEALKASDIVNSISVVTKEKSISMDLVLDTMKDALATAAKRYLGKPANVEVKIDKDKGTIEVFTRQTVVDFVEDPEFEIGLEEARNIDSVLEIGDELIQDLDVDLFGRTAIQTAKQVIVQRVREAEREKVYADYSERLGELVTGTVQQIERGNILVNLGRTEALLPYREQIRKEHYRQGENIRACIVEVKNNIKGPQVIISRTSPEFLARLFELEVPEIYDKTVRIIKVVRDPGHRSKIAVTTNDSRVDPVGACVGMRGNRVQAIVRELSNERIDIISWTEEISLLVRRVFAPAEVKRVIPVGDHKIVVVIREEDLAQAIGREGQNIRLASKMLDREIDVFGDQEFASLTEEQKEEALSETPSAPVDQMGEEVETDLPINEPDEEVTYDEAYDDMREEARGERFEQNDNEENPTQDTIIEGAVSSLSESDEDADSAIDEASENKEGNEAGSSL